jgi:hypothetical protein
MGHDHCYETLSFLFAQIRGVLASFATHTDRHRVTAAWAMIYKHISNRQKTKGKSNDSSPTPHPRRNTTIFRRVGRRFFGIGHERLLPEEEKKE